MLNTGWIGRYLVLDVKGCDKPTGALDDTLSLALKAQTIKSV
jgi:hypothetical protein